MICGALLNQASSLIRLKNFKDAEARCSKLLAVTSGGGGGSRPAAARGRAFHFRGFSRLRQGMHAGACADFRSALSSGTSGVDEAKALLAEAEAGLTMSSCPDPEAKGRDILRRGEGREAARYFREAASRARCRTDGGRDGASKDHGSERGGRSTTRERDRDAGMVIARNSRMEAVAVAMAGDRSSAEMLLRGVLRELQAGREGGTRSSGGAEEEALTQAALGSLLSQDGKHAAAVLPLRAAVAALDGEIAGVPANKGSEGESGNSSQDSSSYATKISPPSPPLSMTARSTALTRTLMVTLSFLGISLLALEKQHGASMNGTSANEENTDTVGDGAAKPNPEGKSGTVAGGPGSGQGSAVVAELVKSAESADSAAAASPVTASAAQVGVGEVDEAIDVLKRALGMLRTEAAALAAASTAEVEAARAGVSSAVGIDRTEEVKEQTARVLDVLSEAYAHQRRWEQARSAAEQSLTAYRGLGDAGKTGATATLLSLGHLVLELHGVGGGIEEASARWEEAARCIDGWVRPSDAANVHVKIAGFYSKVARSDPSRLESFSGKIAAHYSAAAGLFSRERAEVTGSLDRAAASVATAEAPGNVVAEDGEGSSNPRPPLPPSAAGSLGGGPSPWELAEKEASAWEGFAGAVGNDHEEAGRALRKAEGLLDQASVSEKDEAWTLRKVGVLHGLALASARCGEHGIAEDKLLVAIGELQKLDGVNADTKGGAHQGVLVDLLKYLAIARRARGDMPGAKEALAKVEALAGSEGREHVEELNRLLASNKISVD
eukprot:jgi/Undpi1/2077/HiC_scaffold_12.g05463.m1